MDSTELLLQLLVEALPAILILLGFLTLSVGFGLRFRVVFAVDQLNPTYAKVAGGMLLAAGLVLLGVQGSVQVSFGDGLGQDPYLPYYLVSTPMVVGLYWAALALTDGGTQRQAMHLSYLLVGALLTLAVGWHALDVFAALDMDKSSPLLRGLGQRHSFLPYFVLLGSAALVALWLIFRYTRSDDNAVNRMPLLSGFVLSSLYFGLCRVAWEIVDKLALRQLGGGG